MQSSVQPPSIQLRAYINCILPGLTIPQGEHAAVSVMTSCREPVALESALVFLGRGPLVRNYCALKPAAPNTAQSKPAALKSAQSKPFTPMSAVSEPDASAASKSATLEAEAAELKTTDLTPAASKTVSKSAASRSADSQLLVIEYELCIDMIDRSLAAALDRHVLLGAANLSPEFSICSKRAPRFEIARQVVS
jgi:hypothetical protein